MKLRKSHLLLLCACLFTFGAWTCNSKDAAKAADAYGNSLKAVHDAVDAGCAPVVNGVCTGIIPTAQWTAALNVLLRANEAGVHVNAAIRSGADANTVSSNVNAALVEAKAALADGTLGIKNPQKAAEVAALVQAVQLTITQIQTIYKISGGK